MENPTTIRSILSLMPLATIPIMVLALLQGHVGFVVGILGLLSIVAIALGIKLIKDSSQESQNAGHQWPAKKPQEMARPHFKLIKQSEV